jgi:hypothetical protein
VAVPEKKFEELVTTWRARTERDGDRVVADLLHPSKMAVHHSSESDEHYTPGHILDAVIAVLGEQPSGGNGDSDDVF